MGITYPSQNLAMKDQLNSAALKKFPRGVPYDYRCPAVQDVVNRRLCSTYGIYFASTKEVTNLKPIHNVRRQMQKENDPPPLPRPRPQRVAAKRQGELLCALEFQELEWVVDDDVDVEGLVIPDGMSVEYGTPVMEVQEPVWLEEELLWLIFAGINFRGD